MNSFVTVYPDNKHYLESFLLLAERFYLSPVSVHMAEKDEPKSNQLRRLLESIDDEYLILLEVDFYFRKHVDMSLIECICQFCKQQSIDRFSLQSKNDYDFTDWPETNHKIGEHRVYKTDPRVTILFSLEASVWKRSFLLSQLQDGWNDAEIEVQASNNIRKSDAYEIRALDTVVIHYRDAMLDGKQRIWVHKNPLRFTVPEGCENVLYPFVEKSRKLILE